MNPYMPLYITIVAGAWPSRTSPTARISRLDASLYCLRKIETFMLTESKFKETKIYRIDWFYHNTKALKTPLLAKERS